MERENSHPSETFLPTFEPDAKGAPAYRHYARGAQKCYKPLSTRWPFLFAILLVVFGLVGIVEAACHIYPVQTVSGGFLGFNSRRRATQSSEDEITRVYGRRGDANLEPRQSAGLFERDDRLRTKDSAFIGSSTSQSSVSLRSVSVSTTSGSTSSVQVPSTTSSSFTQATYTTIPSVYIPTTSTSISSGSVTVTIDLSTDEGAYITTTTSNVWRQTTVVGNTPSSAFIQTTSAPKVVTTVTLPGAGAGGVVTGTTIPGEYIPTTTSPSVVTTVTLPGAVHQGSSDEGVGRLTKSFFYTRTSAYVPPTTTSDITQPGPQATGNTISSAFIEVTSYIPPGGGSAVLTTITEVPEPATTAYIPPGGTPTSLSEVPEASTTAYIPTFVGSAVPVSYIPLSPVTTITNNGVPGGTQDNPTTAPLVPISTINSGGVAVVVMGTPTAPLVPVSTWVDNGVTKVVLGVPTTTPLVPVSTITSNGVAIVVVAPIVPLSTITSGGVTQVVMGIPTGAPLVPVSTITSGGIAEVVMGVNTPTSLVPVSTVTSNGKTMVVFGSPTITSAPSNTYSVVTMLTTSTSGSVAYVYLTTETLSPTPSASAGPQSSGSVGSDNKKASVQFTPMSYFAAWYLPTILAVALRVVWTVVYNNARMMEPFYRLATPSGSRGKHSLGNLYLSMGTIVPEPILALLSGHSYMLIVSTTTYVIELVAPLSSEFIAVDVQGGCANPTNDPNHPCPPRIIVHLLPARILQAILGLIGLFILLTIYLSRSQSGVNSNPSSIVTMASLLHHPDILEDFKALADADDREVARILNEQSYRLEPYQAGADGMKYGLVPVMRTERHEINRNSAYIAVANPEGGTQVRRRHRTFLQRHFWRTGGDLLLGTLMLGFLGVVIAYYLDGSDSMFNRFFNSQSFGPKFLLVFGAGLIVTQWKRLEREVRTYQPYRNLASSKSSSPKHTILSETTSTPWSTLPMAIYHFEFFTALVAFCYIISEVVVIVVATIPFSNNQYYIGFLAAAYITFGILGLQILVFIALVTRWRWTGPRLERDPDTLLGVWTLLVASGIRKDFEDLGTARRKDLVDTVEEWGGRYWLTEVVCKDGVARMGIHEDTAHAEPRFEGLRIEHPDGVVSHVRF